MSQDPLLDVPKELREGRSRSKVRAYQDLVVGRRGWGFLILYELVLLTASWVPGALGLLLRSKLYPLLLGECGRDVHFGNHVVLRHPRKIRIGDGVTIDDHCVLDAKGRNNRGITIGDGVFLGRNTILACKEGDIELEDGVNISYQSTIFSCGSVRVGHDCLLAAYCYLVGGTHEFDRLGVAVTEQKRHAKNIEVGPGGWIGAGARILDGVRIGREVVVGANSVVTGDLPDYAVAAGAPAKVLRRRDEEAAREEETPAGADPSGSGAD